MQATILDLQLRVTQLSSVLLVLSSSEGPLEKADGTLQEEVQEVFNCAVVVTTNESTNEVEDITEPSSHITAITAEHYSSVERLLHVHYRRFHCIVCKIDNTTASLKSK